MPERFSRASIKTQTIQKINLSIPDSSFRLIIFSMCDFIFSFVVLLRLHLECLNILQNIPSYPLYIFVQKPGINDSLCWSTRRLSSAVTSIYNTPSFLLATM